MKALVIADDESVIARFNSILTCCGYDCIVYRWLLKALDNVEEIAPHLVVISARDYPRHWKTFAQYISGILGKTNPKIILYIDKDFSLDEKKKAQALNITAMLPSECSDNDFTQIISHIQITPIIKQNNMEQSEEMKQVQCMFIYTNPVTGIYETGTVRSHTNNMLSLEPENLNEVQMLMEGMHIAPCTIKCNGHISAVCAVVKETPSSDNNNNLILTLSECGKAN